MSLPENHQTDLAAVIDTAIVAAAPHIVKAPVEDGDDSTRAAVFSLPEGATVKAVDVEALIAPYRDRPRRKSGNFHVQNAESFITYLAKHTLGLSTEVWADPVQARIVAVINAHMGTTGDGIEDYAGWSDHRLTFSVQLTDAWKAWIAHDGKFITQQQFAEHIENRLVDVTFPDSADMLELAQTFQATIGVNFESSKRLSTGQRQFEYRETIDARAGQAGRLDVPERFVITIAPFEGADPVEIPARFRYRMSDGKLAVGYQLERPNDVLRAAFDNVVDKIANGIDAPVFTGTTATA